VNFLIIDLPDLAYVYDYGSEGFRFES